MNAPLNTEAKKPVDQTGWLVALGLKKSFGKRPVVENVSIAVRRGEAVGLLVHGMILDFGWENGGFI